MPIAWLKRVFGKAKSSGTLPVLAHRYRPSLEILEDRLAPAVGLDPFGGLPVLLTDQQDYPPGSTVTLLAENFQPGETVNFQVLRIDGQANVAPGIEPWQVTDGGTGDPDGTADGKIQTSWYVHDQYLGATLQATAVGMSSGFMAQAVFTDGQPRITGVSN